MSVSPLSKLKIVGEDSSASILKMAIFAVGGQGGGVLSNWVADLAELGGYDAQVTSVAGVAQRTGATIYYVEMAPKSDSYPVFALAPSQGDVDVVIASELMEAGRAVMRGFVTENRTTLIASSHRILAVSEKQQPGDGRGDGDEVLTSLASSAKQLVCFDMEELALRQGSMISASLFGALARSKALPFSIDQFEAVIRNTGKGVEASIAAFRAAVDYDEKQQPVMREESKIQAHGSQKLLKEWQQLLDRVIALPVQLRPMAEAGLKAVVDYQDLAYGREYLDHLERILRFDQKGKEMELSVAAAKYIARAMCYDDIPRVADLKTRETRQTRLRREQQISTQDVAQVTEYFHPRVEELISILPAGLGKWAETSSLAQSVLKRFAGNGRRIRTDKISGFLMLWIAASLRPRRRKLLRHQTESAHLNRLIETSLAHVGQNYDLAVEVFKCQRLIKGYSDTHLRGHSKFDKIMAMITPLNGRDDAADWLRRLREAALKDEAGDALDGAIKTIQSFTTTPATPPQVSPEGD